MSKKSHHWMCGFFKDFSFFSVDKKMKKKFKEKNKSSEKKSTQRSSKMKRTRHDAAVDGGGASEIPKGGVV